MLDRFRRSDSGTVLVVDDDPAIQDMLSTVLSVEGFDVSVANDGIGALVEMSDNDYDLVVLDVMMPRLDGIELAKRIRADKGLGRIGIVFVSARATDEDVWEGWTSGADSYLTKPVDVAELVDEVHRVLGARQVA